MCACVYVCMMMNIILRILFLCNHEVEVGEPETADVELDEDCRVDFQWATKLACPPHDQVGGRCDKSF